MTAERLPAVVLGIDTPTGLAVVRDLGRSGIPVYGIGRSRTALVMSSRHLRRALVRAPGPDALVEQLAVLGAELGQACLFAISESDIALLNRHRHRLDAYKLMFADEERMRRVVNKDCTYAAAARVGVRTPRTEQVERLEQAQALCASLRFPVVLKWSNPHEAAARLAPLGLAPDKTRYCHGPDELLAYLGRFERAGMFPLIQEYCPGYGLGQFFLMKNGQAEYTFQHRRVHEWPPEGGASSLCESLPAEAHAELMTKSLALLRELEWDGVAMVEYRHDPATGASALMEINGRFWGSLPLAYHAGARFATLYYTLFGLEQPIAGSRYRSGIRCRYMIPETKRLVRILFAQHKIADKTARFRRLPELLGYLAGFLRVRSRYYVFELRDPGPFFGDMRQILGKAVEAMVRPASPSPRPLGAPRHPDKNSSKTG